VKKILACYWLLLVFKISIGIIFVYAGIIKMINPMAFADSIATFQLLPAYLINILALGLPPFEVLMGLLLIIGKWQREAAFAILILCLAFCLVLIQALIRGLEVDCGCFGGSTPSVWKTWFTLSRDLVLVCIIGFIYLRLVQQSKLTVIKNTEL
jgi:uncharacterized membrane protein YphA (DoxX/SURF4 family)